MMREHDGEPVLGLPEALPHGERLLWQGAPEWSAVARRVFRIRLLAAYFLGLVAWSLGNSLAEGATLAIVGLAGLRFVALAAAALGLLTLIAWLIARTTVYTITDRRLVIRFGVALSMTVNIPFRLIASAAVRTYPDGSGDIVLSLLPGQRIAYLLLWPHVRPWRLLQPSPMLRGIPASAVVADALSRALGATVDTEAPTASPRAVPAATPAAA